jgi:hypothetical protein
MCPRSTLEKADEYCLAKLPSFNDNVDVVGIESTTMNLVFGDTQFVCPKLRFTFYFISPSCLISSSSAWN